MYLSYFAINIKIYITVKHFETNNAYNYVLKYDEYQLLKNAVFYVRLENIMYMKARFLLVGSYSNKMPRINSFCLKLKFSKFFKITIIYNWRVVINSYFHKN